MRETVVIVGAGQAGASVAQKLRMLGFPGRVVLLGAEPHPPYQRPPLSKKYLAAEWTRERLWLKPPTFWADNNVELQLGTKVRSVDLCARTVVAGDETLGWDKLVFATGARPRRWPPGFAGKRHVYELRNIADVDQLRGVFGAGRRMLVIGGGFVGLETAAVAASHGLSVTVIERAERILERAVGEEVSTFLRRLHESHSVRVIEGATIAKVLGDADFEGVQMMNGDVIAADCALIGVGVEPDVAVARAAGIDTDNGIVVDAYGRTSHPPVWAAGDCAQFPFAGRAIRLESVQNAVDQAEAVAADLVGAGQPYEPVPWFWSDQYDTKLQIAGLARQVDRTVSLRSARGEAHWRFSRGALVAVEAINDARAFMAARKLMEQGIAVQADLLTRDGFDPRALLV